MSAVPRRTGRRKRSRKSQKRRKSRLRLALPLPSARLRRRLVSLFKRLPGGAQVLVGLVLVAIVVLAANGVYQVVRKPSELFFPVSGRLAKTPAETWETYAPIFHRHATRTITPDFLAALAQVEGSGNPIVRTYWRWAISDKPFEIYRPASSAVGMYQITDGTAPRHFGT